MRNRYYPALFWCAGSVRALNFMYYNFVRIHSKLRVTPAMAAGVTDRLWEIADIAALIDAREGPPKKRGPYKARQPHTSEDDG